MADRPAGAYFHYFFHTQAGSERAWPAARQEAKEAPGGKFREGRFQDPEAFVKLKLRELAWDIYNDYTEMQVTHDMSSATRLAARKVQNEQVRRDDHTRLIDDRRARAAAIGTPAPRAPNALPRMGPSAPNGSGP